MQPISRMLLFSAASAALLAPAMHARPVSESAGATDPRAQVYLDDSGLGSGHWLPATDGMGFASAKLYDGFGNHRYTMRANLIPGLPPPPNMDEQGGFLGQLFSVDGRGRRVAMAEISGKWTRHPNGWGDFDVEVLVPTGDKRQPLVAIGAIQGSLLPPGIMPMTMDRTQLAGGEKIDEPTVPCELVLMWTIPEVGKQ